MKYFRLIMTILVLCVVLALIMNNHVNRLELEKRINKLTKALQLHSEHYNELWTAQLERQHGMIADEEIDCNVQGNK